MVMHAFVTSRLDYCNALYISAPQSCVFSSAMESVNMFWFHCIGWLKYKTDLKNVLFVYKSLHNQAPQYLSDLLHPYTQSRDSGLLHVPRAHLKNRGDRAFSVVGPKLWNSLPIHIRIASTLSIFKSTLKTDFFSLAFHIFWLAVQWSFILPHPFYSVCFIVCISFTNLLTCFVLQTLYSTLVDFGCFKCAL